jgi:hypothetical protein
VDSEDFDQLRMTRDAWDQACATSLDATVKMAAARLLIAYSPEDGYRKGDSKREYWLATDIGLAMLVVRQVDQQVKAIADWVAWRDVVDPELHTDFLLFEEGGHSTMRLTIQRPSIVLETASNLEPLRDFARAVMGHGGHGDPLTPTTTRS